MCRLYGGCNGLTVHPKDNKNLEKDSGGGGGGKSWRCKAEICSSSSILQPEQLNKNAVKPTEQTNSPFVNTSRRGRPSEKSWRGGVKGGQVYVRLYEVAPD